MSPDIHYLKREFDELVSQDARVSGFLWQGTLDGVWYWNLEKPKDEWISPEFWQLLGIDPSNRKHLAKEWQDRIFEDDLKVAVEQSERICADPTHPYDQVFRFTHASGETVWIRCRGIAIRDDNDKPIRLLRTHVDCTDFMLAQNQLDETNLRLKTVLDTASSGIIALNQDKHIIEINPAGRHILGVYDEPVPFPWPSRIAFLDPERLQTLEPEDDPILRAMDKQELRNETNLMTRARGDSQRYVRVSSSNIESPDSDVNTVLILEDVSELEQNRQNVERSSRLDALGQLTGGIAHDFNNLLATIQYALQLSLEGELPEKTRHYLVTALSAMRRGTRLSNRLLAFARPQPGLAHARKVATVFQELFDLIEPTIEESVTLDIREIDPDLSIFCDQSQLENALVNLILNARDALRRSENGNIITIDARGLSGRDLELADENLEDGAFVARGTDLKRQLRDQKASAKSRRFVEISISDNGAGMTPEVKRRAIDPFFTTKDNKDGTGLGLSTVYGFVQQAGGELRIYSEKDEGTTVRLTLPRGTDDGRREDAVENAEIQFGQGQTVLVVEDEPWLLEMMNDMLTKLGYKVVAVATGKQALEIIEKKQTVDVLLTDIVMPGQINGFELARRVVAMQPSIGVVYMSGYSGFSAEEMGSVVAPMVNKPCPPDRISAAIQEVLSERNEA